MKKLWTWLLAAALLTTGCAVQGNTAMASDSGDAEERVSGSFTYTLNDSGAAVITGYSGNDLELTVPDKVDEYPVAEIGAESFWGYDSLIRVSLPEGLQSIGDSAFSRCYSLTGITLPEGLQSIGDGAFYNCCSLTGITLPEGLQSIGDKAFFSCGSLTAVTLPDSLKAMGGNPFADTKAELSLSPDHPRFVLVDGMLIDKGSKRLVCYPYGSSAKTCVVPEGILHIGDSAFSSCDNLTSITLPEGLQSIGDIAFFWCINLTGITLPDSLKAMGGNPFACAKAELSLSPDHPRFALADGMLIDKDEKRLVSYPYGSQAETCFVPEGILNIGARAFFDCDSLTSITLPEGLKSIGDCAFLGCESLTGITLPEGLQSIGYRAFYNCDSLISLNIPASVTSIGQEVFKECPSLTLIVAPDSPGAAFADRHGIPFVYAEPVVTPTPAPTPAPETPAPATPVPETPVPETEAPQTVAAEPPATQAPEPTAAPAPAFDPAALFKEYRCDGYDYKLNPQGEAMIIRCPDAAGEVVLPAALDGHPVAAIDDWAFYNSNLLTGVTLPEGLRSIGNRAFGRCIHLAGIALPDSLETLGGNPFVMTKAKLSLSPEHPHLALLNGMLFHKGERRLVYYPFDSPAGACEVPEGTLHIGQWAFCNALALRTVLLPEGLQSIEGDAFTWCFGLRSVNIPASVISIDLTAFTDCNALTLTVAPDSPGAAFADRHGIPFVYAETTPVP